MRREERFYLAMDEYDRGIILRALNDLRNKQTAAGRPREPVDDVLIKVAEAPAKRFRVIREAAPRGEAR